jgi:hypothetical protein
VRRINDQTREFTIAALKTTLKPWNKSMKIVLEECTAFFAAISEAGSGIRGMALPKLNQSRPAPAFRVQYP